MAKKRFTDIEIWDREWYMELKPVHKCLMKYIFDKCDASGCWKPNWKLASLHIGETVNFSDLKKLPEDQYEVLESGKIFIPDFIKFQYGQLSKKSPAHNPIFLAIEKNNLSDRLFNRVSNSPKDMDKEKEEEKDKEKGEVVKKKINGNHVDIKDSNLFRKPTVPNFEDVYRIFLQNGGTQEMAKTFFDKNEGTGWFYKGSPIINYSTMIPSYVEQWKKNNSNNATTKSGSTAGGRNAGVNQLLQEIKDGSK